MTTTTKTALAALALALASFATQAQAHTVIRYLPKGGVPYAVPHQEPAWVTAAPVHKVNHTKHAARHAQLAKSPK